MAWSTPIVVEICTPVGAGRAGASGSSSTEATTGGSRHRLEASRWAGLQSLLAQLFGGRSRTKGEHCSRDCGTYVILPLG
jgi:hypothetical protein